MAIIKELRKVNVRERKSVAEIMKTFEWRRLSAACQCHPDRGEGSHCSAHNTMGDFMPRDGAL